MAREVDQKIRSGFTLIELLVVITIIGLLVALLFPVFAAAKKSAFKASTTSALRQTFSSANLYSNDYDDRVPYAVDDCDWRGLCTSSYAPEWKQMIKDNNIPPFSAALKPYGFISSLFKIQVGTGPQDFEKMGGNFYYPLKLSSQPLQNFEEYACPYFFERKTYLWNGGQYNRVAPDFHWLTLYFNGHVKFSTYEGVFTRADACMLLNK